MNGCVTDRVHLSDSALRTRPHISDYLKSDANAGGTVMQQIEQDQVERHMKFPSLVGRKDIDSFSNIDNLNDPAYKKWNDEGDHRAPAPTRLFDNNVTNLIDPVSGFVSAAGDVDRNTGHTRIKTMTLLNHTPQGYNPRESNTIRLHESAPPELRRRTEKDPGSSYPWSGRKKLDSAIRASLGGWTSDKDPRKADLMANCNEDSKSADCTKHLRDNLALKYVYTSAAQRAFEDIPWDQMIDKRRWRPTTTLEPKADQISQAFQKKRYEPKATDFQNVGRSWDWFQMRKPHYKKNIPIPGVVYQSASSKTKQIPGYGGCVGGDGILDVENPEKTFEPYTIKRVDLPPPSDTSHRPDIPNYTGCTLHREGRYYQPMHSTELPPEPQTTLRVHRRMPLAPTMNDFKKTYEMSKMITTVPPSNPFNRIDKDPAQHGEENKDKNGPASSQQAVLVA